MELVVTLFEDAKGMIEGCENKNGKRPEPSEGEGEKPQEISPHLVAASGEYSNVSSYVCIACSLN